MAGYTYPEGTNVYLCEHEEKKRREEPDHISYMSLWAGDSVRFEICRLCSTMTLGNITRSSIRERVDDWIASNQRDKVIIDVS